LEKWLLEKPFENVEWCSNAITTPADKKMLLITGRKYGTPGRLFIYVCCIFHNAIGWFCIRLNIGWFTNSSSGLYSLHRKASRKATFNLKLYHGEGQDDYMTTRKALKALPVLLLLLIVIAGCAKHTSVSQPPINVPSPQLVKADPAKTSGTSSVSLFFLNNQLGWVAANQGSQQPATSVVLQTSDGGRDWVQLNSPGVSAIQQLAFADAYHGWALVTATGSNSTAQMAIMATVDGGNTWTQQWSKDMQQEGGQPYKMQFLNAKNGFFLAGDIFEATRDGGVDWAQLPIAQGMSGFSFISQLVGWAVGANSIWSTTDGGVTWHRQWTMPDSIASQFPGVGGTGGTISFVSPNSGWVYFQSATGMFKSTKVFLHTDDGGSNWSVTSAYLPPAQTFNEADPSVTTCFDPVSTTTALLAASPPTDYPVLFRTDDKGSDWKTLSSGMSSTPGLPQGSSWGDLSFINENEGWAAVIIWNPTQSGSSKVVSNLSLLHTLDGGQTWTTQYP
jgi:photosystem II stability/assembly factor-like uncharacterized protein